MVRESAGIWRESNLVTAYTAQVQVWVREQGWRSSHQLGNLEQEMTQRGRVKRDYHISTQPIRGEGIDQALWLPPGRPGF